MGPIHHPKKGAPSRAESEGWGWRWSGHHDNMKGVLDKGYHKVWIFVKLLLYPQTLLSPLWSLLMERGIKIDSETTQALAGFCLTGEPSHK